MIAGYRATVPLVARGGRDEQTAIPTAVQEGVGTPLPAPSTLIPAPAATGPDLANGPVGAGYPLSCWRDCCRTSESQR